jgi:hypothetical protein
MQVVLGAGADLQAAVAQGVPEHAYASEIPPETVALAVDVR